MITLNDYFPIYGVFLLFLGICGNTFMQFFPCDIRNMLQKNTFVRSLFLFFTLFFSIVLSTFESNNKNLSKYFSETIVVYLIFVTLIKNPPKLFILNTFLYFIVYVLFLAKFEHIDTPHYKSIVIANNIITVIALSLTMIGAIITFQKVRKHHRNDFAFLKFFFKEEKCKDSAVFSLKKKINHE